MGIKVPDKLERTVAEVMAAIIGGQEVEADYGILTHELKERIDIPEKGAKAPPAKKLKRVGRKVAGKRLGNDAWIAAYQNGYVLYHTCGDYLYASDGTDVYLSEQFGERSHGMSV